jgi:Putative transposase/Transposase zinc-binding domain
MLDHGTYRGETSVRPTVAGVLRTFGPDCRRRHPFLPPQQWRVLGHLCSCHTSALGGRVQSCDDCGFERVIFHGCRDRHCPSCQKLGQADWIAQRHARLVPVGHFHVVVTLPEPMRAVAPGNERLVYDMLLRAACATLLELGHDPKWLGAELGITAVLHTWTRDLRLPPHVHCIVTAGGLSSDGSAWVNLRKSDFLFPLRVIGALLRGKMLDGLAKAHRAGSLRFRAATAHLACPDRFAQLLSELKNTNWITFCEAPRTSSPRAILRYLGRYVNCVALSDERILRVDDQTVTFATKNGDTCTLEGHEFVRRFLMHVLPHSFVKIRHCGLYAPCRVRTRLQAARFLASLPSDPFAILAKVFAGARDKATAVATMSRALDPHYVPHEPASVVHCAAFDWQQRLFNLSGNDSSRCPRCAHPLTHRQFAPFTPPPLARAHSPPCTQSHAA